MSGGKMERKEMMHPNQSETHLEGGKGETEN
jgi:hypothetical protein